MIARLLIIGVAIAAVAAVLYDNAHHCIACHRRFPTCAEARSHERTAHQLN